MKTAAPKKLDLKAIRKWMLDHVEDHIDEVDEVNSTSLAEEAASVFDAYLDTQDYEIPEEVFDLAAEISIAHDKAKEATAPPGWEKTVKKMKKHPEIDNPWALAWSMKNKGDKPGGSKKGASDDYSGADDPDALDAVDGTLAEGDYRNFPVMFGKLSDSDKALWLKQNTLEPAPRDALVRALLREARLILAEDAPAAPAGKGSEDFIELVKSQLQLDGRQIRFKNRYPLHVRVGPSQSTLGGERYDTVTINYINLPEGVGGAGGGAEAENNRAMFFVEGFGKETPHSPPPRGKVRISQEINHVTDRSNNMRAKTGTPEQIAKYLADYLNKIVKTVEPRYTHTKA